ncbi:MAG: hypothetical protein KBT36_06290 [Kurthia sp.]|nr:hypothetical protein [Candidatus Kurthia equi]
MNLYDVILIAVSLISIPLVCAVSFDALYSKKKQIQISLFRTAGWYAAIFTISFVPTFILIYNMKN